MAAISQKRIASFLWLVFFFHGMALGFWIPALTNVLKAQGLSSWVALVFAVPPVCALISPLIGGGLADERMPAQKLMAWSSLTSAVAIAIAFGMLHAGLGPWFFIGGMMIYSLASGPTWGLLATTSLTHLENSQKTFPLVRLGATFGWISGGCLTSYALQADSSPICGYGAAVARIITGVLAFYLPHTPPLGAGKSWKRALGLGAWDLFRNRNHAVLFLITGLFTIPLAAFYMYAPELFAVLGNETPAASMSIAQWTEVGALVSLSYLMVHYRLKTLLLWGLTLSAVRFGLSGYAGLSGIVTWHFLGVALHGICYTIYFVTAQVYLNRRVEPEMRGQAQGLLTFMSAGIGPLIGSLFVGWLRVVCVDDLGNGWDAFWWILAGIIAALSTLFATLYKSLKVGG